MNDLDLIDRFGPSAEDPTDAALAAARARLTDAIAAPSPRERRNRRLPLLVAASVVAAAGAGIAVAPALMGSDHSIALAAVDPLTFPVTPTWMPEGLGKPVFSAEPGLQFARYGEGDNRVGINAHVDLDNRCRDAVRVDINGHPGWGSVGCPDGGPDRSVYVIMWKQDDGEVLSASGRGRYADPALVERIAESVVQKPQPVDLFLTIAPAGWQLLGYQSDHHVTWRDPHGGGAPDQWELSVNVIDRVADDLSHYGVSDSRAISVDGRPAIIGQQDAQETGTTLWILQATSPDGTPFSMAAPGRLTEAQVIEVAAGVRHR